MAWSRWPVRTALADSRIENLGQHFIMAWLGNRVIVYKLKSAAEFGHGGHRLNLRDAHCQKRKSRHFCESDFERLQGAKFTTALLQYRPFKEKSGCSCHLNICIVNTISVSNTVCRRRRAADHLHRGQNVPSGLLACDCSELLRLASFPSSKVLPTRACKSSFSPERAAEALAPVGEACVWCKSGA